MPAAIAIAAVLVLPARGSAVDTFSFTEGNWYGFTLSRGSESSPA